MAPDRVFLDGEAEELILPTNTGQIGILQNHTPLITGLDIGVLLLREKSEWSAMAVMGGFALIQDNTLTLLVNEAEFGKNINYSFNRKEAKTHGEGGSIVGSELFGSIAIIDDVITAGTAVREVIDIIHAADAKPAAVLIGVNRQERGKGSLSAIQEVEQHFNIPVISIVCLDDIIDYIKQQGDENRVIAMQRYRDSYGV